jgi:glutamyl-tRNA synthetase
MTVITRFAPSPTGFLHIGGGRTALFNWLYAKRHGGKMLLRIEDTDRERSTEAAIAAILDGLNWLGLDWDGDVVYQFSRAARHKEVAESLLASGRAYYRDPSEAPEGVKPVIRLKAPTEGETVVEDEVQGRVVWQNKDLDDLVLLRSDGTPTYMLAVVVDDHDMNVTHIIRGDDHLTNGARQTQIYQALGWDVPKMAHIPLIHGPDGAKLSKRHGALGVEAYRSLGYLPEALRNYLVRLGWSHGDQEIFSTQEMIDAFDLGSIGRSPARFDFAKLENLNGHYMRQADDEHLVNALEGLLPELDKDEHHLGRTLTPGLRQKLLVAMPGLKERAKTLVELLDSAYYLYAKRPLHLDEKAASLLSDGRARLDGIIAKLEAVSDWTGPNVEAVVREHAEAIGAKLGQVAQPLRAALTGRATSPGLFDVMAVLGRDETLSRLRDQLKDAPAA